MKSILRSSDGPAPTNSAPGDPATTANPAARHTQPQPLFEEEKAVQERGYPDVTTNTLLPDGRFDKHKTSSKNTHLVESGSMDGRNSAAPRHCKVLKAGEYGDMPAGVYYKGKTGPESRAFIEGHQNASPTAINWIVDNDAKHQQSGK